MRNEEGGGLLSRHFGSRRFFTCLPSDPVLLERHAGPARAARAATSGPAPAMGSRATRQLRRSQYRASRAVSSSATGVVRAPNSAGQKRARRHLLAGNGQQQPGQGEKGKLEGKRTAHGTTRGAAKVGRPAKPSAPMRSRSCLTLHTGRGLPSPGPSHEFCSATVGFRALGPARSQSFPLKQLTFRFLCRYLFRFAGRAWACQLVGVLLLTAGCPRSRFASPIPETRAAWNSLPTRGSGMSSVRYAAALPSGRLFVQPSGLTYAFYDPAFLARHHHGAQRQLPRQPRPAGPSRPTPTRWHFEKASPRARLTATAPTPGERNYFVGSDARRWASHVGPSGSCATPASGRAST